MDESAARVHGLVDIAEPDSRLAARARQRLSSLAMPPGSLGALETLAVKLAAAQGRLPPAAAPSRVIIFAGDHGVAREHGVSAYPSEVTRAMVGACASGGAVVSVFSNLAGAQLEVVDVGVRGALAPTSDSVVYAPVSVDGTHDLVTRSAMSRAQAERSILAGAEAADRAGDAGIALLCVGELGIGNSTSAAALAAHFLGRPASELVGPGTGLDAEGVARKRAVVSRALERCSADPNDAVESIADLGGFEIGALCGCMLRAAQWRIPVLVDGFIASAAALAARRLAPAIGHYLVLSTRSAEPGHRAIIDALALGEPLLDLGLRLGEGSAAALALPIARTACHLLGDVATLASLFDPAQEVR